MAEIRRLDEASQVPDSTIGVGSVAPPDRTLPGMPEGANLPPQAYEGRLTRAAQNAGTAVGSAVNRVRSGLSLVKPSPASGLATGERLASTAKDLAGKASSRMEELKEDAQLRGERLARTVQQRTAQLGDDVRQRIRDLNAQSQRIQREYPIQVILGCAAAAFVLGFTLRIWRSSRA